MIEKRNNTIDPRVEGYLRKTEDMKQLSVVENNILANPHADLNSDEIRFLYNLNTNPASFDYKRNPRIEQIRKERGGKDQKDLIQILPESVSEQFESSYAAYERMMTFHDMEPTSEEIVRRQLNSKLNKWQQNGVYEYMAEKMITEGGNFTLVTTPNIKFTEEKLLDLTDQFAKKQTWDMDVDYDMFEDNRYSPSEWSGVSGTDSLRFSLIPSVVDTELNNKNVQMLLAEYYTKQIAYPKLTLQVPSFLETIAYWYTRREQGDDFIGETTPTKTIITHFDMRPQEVELVGHKVLAVPQSGISEDGQILLQSVMTSSESSKGKLSIG